MQIILTWQSIITAGAVVGALGAIATVAVKLVRWVDKQGKQDAELAALRKHHDEDMRSLKPFLPVSHALTSLLVRLFVEVLFDFSDGFRHRAVAALLL